jgi:hypothetical protein
MAMDLMSYYPTVSCDEGFGRDCGLIGGGLYWLPPKADHDMKLLESTVIEDGCFAHPVVVLTVDEKREKAEVFIVSAATQTLAGGLLKS